jgi:hypothetical protein
MDYNDIRVKHLTEKSKDSEAFIYPHYIFSIENSVHFKTLVSGDYKDYNELVKNQPEHSEKIYKELQEEFSLSKMQPIQLEWNGEIQKYLINDGCHRIALLKYNGIDLKDCYYEIRD